MNLFSVVLIVFFAIYINLFLLLDGSVAECLCSVMSHFYTISREDLDPALFTTLENLV